MTRSLSARLRARDDWQLSPYTGWTRDHWTLLCDELVLAARPYASPSHARIAFPGNPGGYGIDIDGLEGFARSFLAVGFRIAGEDGRDPRDFLGWYAKGLAAGVDPRSAERWTRLETHSQPRVEAASIALVLHLTRPWLWDRLDDRVRANVVDWLSGAISAEYPPNNWHWFRVVTQSFLASVGAPHERAEILESLAFADSLAREDGWISDGAERSYDHYAGWALHFYPLIWARMAAGDPEAETRMDQFRARLHSYVDDALAMIGSDGSPLIQGRSLTYRFAPAAPLWVAAHEGIGSPGQLRRAASGMVRHFVDRGAPDRDGLLNLGWHGAWPAAAQDYSGPGSPYWACKALYGLLLPESHPAWSTVEEPLPIEKADVARIIVAPGWLVAGDRESGIVRVINHGTDHAQEGDATADAPLYARLGYSTATSPALGAGAIDIPFDNSVTLIDGDGRATHRTGFRALGTEQLASGTLVGSSTWRAHFVDRDPAFDLGFRYSGAAQYAGRIAVTSVVRGLWEVRIIRVADDAARFTVRAGGWPIGVTHTVTHTAEAARAEVSEISDTAATVATNGLVSSVVGLIGFDAAGASNLGAVTPLASGAVVPWLTAAAAAGERRCALALALDRSAVSTIRLEPPTVAFRPDDVAIQWSDDARDVVGWPTLLV